jgi:exodeoxyribonuclease III
MTIKMIAWNVNGLRSIMKEKYLYDLIEKEKPNIICFGETKLSCPILETQTTLQEKIKGYKYRYFNPCQVRGGYSGTAIFSKKKPLNITHGMNNSELDNEGRVITLEFDNYFLVHVYTPNSGQALQRLKYRIEKWDLFFRKYLKNLNKNKNIIVCGDLNVANEDIDIHNPKGNTKNAGFTNEERESFKKHLSEVNLVDTYRHLNPTKIEYSYWTYRHSARKQNKGWRIDYFLVSKKIINKVKKSSILTDVLGSDHAPVKLSIDI